MASLVSIPLEGGGALLVRPVDTEGDGGDWLSGPVRAGRVEERVRELAEESTATLSDALAPIAQMSRQVLDQLRSAAPHEVQVEFGVALTATAGAVLAKAGGSCHLTIKLTWKPGAASDPASAP